MKTEVHYFIIAHLLSFSTLLAADPNALDFSLDRLEVKVSDQPKGWIKKWSGMGVIEPTHVAGFITSKDRDFPLTLDPKDYAQPPKSDYGKKSRQILFEGLSDRQKAFMLQGRSTTWYGEDGDLYASLRNYAVSEADARQFARNVIRLANSHVLRKKELEEDHLRQFMDKLEGAEKQRTAANETLEKLKDKQREYDQQFVFHADDAEKDLLESREKLKSIAIEIAGVEARTDTLRKFSGMGTAKTQELTHQMLIAQEVELAGALARRRAIEQTRETALEIMSHFRELRIARKEKAQIDKQIASHQQTIKQKTEVLAEPQRHFKPLNIYDNRVTIYPVDTSLQTSRSRNRKRSSQDYKANR